MSDVPPQDNQPPQQPPAGPPPAQPPPAQPPLAGQPSPGQQTGGEPDWQQQGAQAGGGLDPKVGGLLAYLLFGWIGGLIMFLTQKHPEVRFHGAQSILFSIAIFAAYIALWILTFLFGVIGLGPIAVLFSLLTFVLWIGSVVLWILLCIKGYNLDHFKLPVIGDMAERWASN